MASHTAGRAARADAASFYLKITSAETAPVAHDLLYVRITDSSNTTLQTLKVFSNVDKTTAPIARALHACGSCSSREGRADDAGEASKKASRA